MSSSERNQRPNKRGNFRANNRQQHHTNQTNEQQTLNPQQITGGPQDGGFDTSSWGNYQNYYPIQTPHQNANRSDHRIHPRHNQSANQNSTERKNHHQVSSSNFECYEPYKTEEEVLREIDAKTAIRGIVRINAKQYTDAFISDPEGKADFFIDNVRDRNRALHSDEVAAQIKPKQQWKIIPEYLPTVVNLINQEIGVNQTTKQTTSEQLDLKRDTIESLFPNENRLNEQIIREIPDEYFQRTVKVVFLFRRRHSMKAAGFLKKMGGNISNFALFSPMDNRIPRLLIPIAKCPRDFNTRPQDYEKSMFIAQIVDIPADKKLPLGQLIESLGDSEALVTQTKAILMENDMTYEEFSQEIIQCLPLEEDKWKIPHEEYSKRLDLREKCIFTIDPATARDLDDALSCEALEGGLFRVGVHIADVSYFVQERTPLDNEASKRTTSVYLVDQVIPMLPRLLCDQLCSLNPGEDRLTFSVIWTLDENGEILEEKFTRSIIRSCVKLSYEHAQSFLENPTKKFSIDEFPEIQAPFSIDEIHRTVVQLFGLSRKLLAKRAGALSLNQAKLQFQLNATNRTPLSFSCYQQKQSHSLVEEFMLLANTRVAIFLSAEDRVREKVILRRHPPPKLNFLEKTIKQLNAMGIPFERNDLNHFVEKLQQIESVPIKKLIVHLLAKSMELAVYCCVGADENQKFSHYALNVEFYTHFTSPIRRYPDILVHRSLATALGYRENLCQSVKELVAIAELCNDKKSSAKLCSERSVELHLAVFLKEYGTICEPATISGVKDQSVDVYLYRIGIPLRIGINNLPLDHPRTNYSAATSSCAPELTIFWKVDDPPSDFKQVLRNSETVFVDLDGEFDKNQKKYKILGKLRNPKEGAPTNMLEINLPNNIQDKNCYQQVQDFDPYSDY